MFQTICIYTFLMLTMMFCGVLSSRRAALYPNQPTPFFNWEILYPMIFFAIVFGMRYDVGTDHLEYLYNYKTGADIDRYEPIFKWITVSFAEYNIHYSIYFGLFAFIQIFFLYYALKEERYLLPYIAFVLFTGQYFWHWMNAVRQDTAACVFLYAATFIAQKKFWKYSFWCIIACGFHKSAFLLFLIYPLFRGGRNYFRNIPMQLGLIFFVSVIAIYKIDILAFLSSQIEVFTLLLGYEVYSEKVLNNLADLTIYSNVGLYCFIVIDIVIILYNKKLKNYYNSNKFIVLYNLYYVGTVFQTLLINNLALARPFRYFRGFKLFIAAYLLCYLYRHVKLFPNGVVFAFLLCIFAVLYFILIRDYGVFNFFWQV